MKLLKIVASNLCIDSVPLSNFTDDAGSFSRIPAQKNNDYKTIITAQSTNVKINKDRVNGIVAKIEDMVKKDEFTKANQKAKDVLESEFFNLREKNYFVLELKKILRPMNVSLDCC